MQIHSQLIFSCFFSFHFSLPFFFHLLPFIPIKVLASVLQKTWKGNIDQLEVTWLILPPILHLKLDTFFWNSSARIWSMLKMDTLMNGSILAVLAAYQNNPVMPKRMMTSQVVQCLLLQTSTFAAKVKSLCRLRLNFKLPLNNHSMKSWIYECLYHA